MAEAREATVVATRLKLRNWLQLRRFFRINGDVERQLRAAPGLVRYSLKADFIKLHFSSISVWQNGGAMHEFVSSGAHRDAIAAFDEIAIRSKSGFVR